MAGGRPGRPPKPVEQHRDEGTFVPSRHGQVVRLADSVGVPAIATLAPPAHLDDDQAVAWRELSEPVAGSGLLTEADLPAFEMMAVALATFRQANEDVKTNGLLLEQPFGKDSSGEVVYRTAPNPALALRDKAQAAYLGACALFGFTPRDRVSLGLGVVKGQKMAASLDAKIGASPRATKKAAADAA